MVDIVDDGCAELPEKVVEVPVMRFRGLKVYLESKSNKEDELAIKHFADFIKHHTGCDMRDSPFYHLKAKQFLGTG